MNIPLLEPGEEKPLEWDATGLFMWSPTMDVFAVSHTSQIFVIRLLSWERIWTISTEDWGAKVTCLAWKPDGRVLAAGCSDGMIRLLDLETSDVIRSFYAKVDQDMPGEADGSDAIADLSWQTDKFATLDPIAKVRSAGDLLKSMPGLAALPQPRSSSTVFKSHLPTIASPETQEESRPSHINLLVAVTRSGRIHSRVYGSLPIGDNQLPGEARQVRSLHISADLSQLWIVSDVESTDTSKARVVLDIVPSGLDASFKRDLKLIADKTEALNVLLRYLETVVKLMDEEQTKVLETSNGYFKKFVEVLYDHGTSNTPIAELKYMLATGKRTESIEMFLTQHVGERNIRQWEKTVEQGCQSLKSHTVEFLKPACERLHILLSGLAVVPPRGKSGSILRADPIVVRGAIEVCKKIVHTAQRLVLAIEETAMGLSHLTRWLRQILDDIVDSTDGLRSAYDAAPIRRYLEHTFESPAIAACFESDEETGVLGLPDLISDLTHKAGQFFRPRAVAKNPRPSLTIMDYELRPGLGVPRLTCNYLSEDALQIAILPEENSSAVTLIRLRSLGTTGSIEANCSALIVASELRERLQWPHPINCKTIMLYDGVALGLGLEADATDVNGDDGRESDDAMEGLVLSALDSVPFASIEIVGDGADISLLELAGIASETEGAAVELSDFRAFVKLRPGIQIHPNASRRLIGMLDASNGKFSFADIDLDGTVAEDGGGGE